MNALSHSTYSRYSEDNIEGFGTVHETKTQSLGDRLHDVRQKLRVHKCFNRNWKWILASFSASILFLISNIFLGIISIHGRVSRPYILIGNMIACIVKISVFRDARSFNQLMYNFKILDSHSNSINFKFIIKTLGSCAMLVVSGYITILMFNHCFLADVNQGVITSLTILSPIFISILTWFLIKVRRRLFAFEDNDLNTFMKSEQCNFLHILGLLLCCLSCFMIFLKPFSSHGEQSEFSIMLGVNAPIALIILILINAAIFAVKDYLFRRRIFSNMISPYRFYELISIFSGIAAIIIAIYDSFNYNIHIIMVIEAIFAVGVLETIGNYLMIFSLCRENQGFSMFIICSGSIFHTLIAHFVLNQQVEFYQIIALCASMLGCLCSTVGLNSLIYCNNYKNNY